MDSSTAPSGASSVTAYLVFLIFVTTLGPLQFGYHLVWMDSSYSPYY